MIPGDHNMNQDMSSPHMMIHHHMNTPIHPIQLGGHPSSLAQQNMVIGSMGSGMNHMNNMPVNIANDMKLKKTRTRYGWDIMYNALLQYGAQHGHYNVPRRYVCDLPEGTLSPDGKPVIKGQLGSWLTTQRVERANGKLKADRLTLLQNLAEDGKLDWSPLNYLKKSESSWPYMYECLVDYCERRLQETPGSEVTSIPEKKRYVHPRDKVEVGLGRWMHTQNKRRRAGKLRPDRLAKIQELVDQGKFKWPQPRPNKRTAYQSLMKSPDGVSMNLNMVSGGMHMDMHQGMNIAMMPGSGVPMNPMMSIGATNPQMQYAMMTHNGNIVGSRVHGRNNPDSESEGDSEDDDDVNLSSNNRHLLNSNSLHGMEHVAMPIGIILHPSGNMVHHDHIINTIPNPQMHALLRSNDHRVGEKRMRDDGETPVMIVAPSYVPMNIQGTGMKYHPDRGHAMNVNGNMVNIMVSNGSNGLAAVDEDHFDSILQRLPNGNPHAMIQAQPVGLNSSQNPNLHNDDHLNSLIEDHRRKPMRTLSNMDIPQHPMAHLTSINMSNGSMETSSSNNAESFHASI